MAIAPDTNATTNYLVGQDTANIGLQLGVTDDGYVILAVSILSALGTTVTSVTGDLTLTFLGAKSSISGACRIEFWGGVVVLDGSKPNITINLSAPADFVVNAASYSGVNQSTPTEALSSAQATNVGAANATVTVTTVADNDWVVSAVATSDASITTSQNELQNISGVLGSGGLSDTGPKTPAGGQAMVWGDIGAAQTWAIMGIALKEAGIAPVEKPVAGKMSIGKGLCL